VELRTTIEQGSVTGARSESPLRRPDGGVPMHADFDRSSVAPELVQPGPARVICQAVGATLVLLALVLDGTGFAAFAPLAVIGALAAVLYSFLLPSERSLERRDRPPS
jgi:hypothetical protein